MRDLAADGLALLVARDGVTVFDWNPTSGPDAAVAVPTAVAAVRDADPTALPPLARTVDPDPLDDLVAAQTDLRVRFEYGDCHLCVESGGRLRVVE